jgi:copper chaperone
VEKTTLNIPDISCEHCEHAITEALTPIDGVQLVQVDIPTKLVTVTYDADKVSVDTFKDVLAEEDYPVSSAS